MSTSTSAFDADAAKLRLRTSPTTAPSGTQSAQETVRTLNATEAQTDKDEKDRKTYGRTPDGTGKQFQHYGSFQSQAYPTIVKNEPGGPFGMP
jgi:phosphatidylethanolamine N-methyltransferase